MKLIVQILCYNEESTLPHSTHSQVGQYRWQWRRDWQTLGSAGGQPLKDGKIKNNTVNDVELGIWDEGQAFQLWDIDILDVSANTIRKWGKINSREENFVTYINIFRQFA